MIRNVTLSAEESFIHKARLKAKGENKSLNELFRLWLGRYISQQGASKKYRLLMKKLSHVRAGRKFTRDEMNER
jgi:hypothetical protein